MKKKESPRPTSAADKKAGLAAFAIHLGRYSDEIRPEGGPPRTFNLKIGPEIVGAASIDWAAVIVAIMDIVVARQHGSQMSDDDYAKHVSQLEEIFTSASPDAEKTVEVFHRLFHLMAHLPDKMNAALGLLFAEAGRDAEIARGKERGSTDIPSPAKFAKWVAKVERDFVMGRLPQMRGGTRKTKAPWRDKTNLRIYADRVDERRLLSVRIKKLYEDCDGEPGWIEDLKRDSSFQRLSVGVPAKVIKWATRRIASEEMSPREREPLSVACEIARQELALPEQSLETLHGYYRSGSELIKQTRKKTKPRD